MYEAPLSLRALLNWYDIQLTSPKLYVLHRRSTPRFGAAIPFGKPVVAQWDQAITLPPVADDEVLVMEADVRESLKRDTEMHFTSLHCRQRASDVPLGTYRFQTCGSSKYDERSYRQQLAAMP